MRGFLSNVGDLTARTLRRRMLDHRRELADGIASIASSNPVTLFGTFRRFK
jgi:hypothetical protein